MTPKIILQLPQKDAECIENTLLDAGVKSDVIELRAGCEEESD